MKGILSGFGNGSQGEKGDKESSGREDSLRELAFTFLSRAGKGKDEVVQLIAREIGSAIAAMLREPLSQIAKNQKIQITFELVPKADGRPKPKRKSKKGS